MYVCMYSMCVRACMYIHIYLCTYVCLYMCVHRFIGVLTNVVCLETVLQLIFFLFKICDRGHISKRWDSQPKVKRNYAGDVALSAAIVISGNNYAKIAMLLKCLNMGVVHSSLHLVIQRDYTFPAIDSYWEGVQDALLKERQGKDIVIAGNCSLFGRN